MNADDWNQHYPVGVAVIAYPGTLDGRKLTTITRTPAWTLGAGDAVVSVDGYAGGIALTHVHAVPDNANLRDMRVGDEAILSGTVRTIETIVPAGHRRVTLDISPTDTAATEKESL